MLLLLTNLIPFLERVCYKLLDNLYFIFQMHPVPVSMILTCYFFDVAILFYFTVSIIGSLRLFCDYFASLCHSFSYVVRYYWLSPVFDKCADFVFHDLDILSDAFMLTHMFSPRLGDPNLNITTVICRILK